MITPLAFDELAPELRERLQPKVDRLGYLGDFFAFTGHQPLALAAFIDLTERLREALPFQLTEVVALTVAARTGNDYERVQHERLSLANGCSETWLRAVVALDPDGQTELNPQEASIQRLVLAALAEYGNAAGDEFAGVADLLGPEATIAVLLTVGRYAAHALIANVLGLVPPVESPIAART